MAADDTVPRGGELRVVARAHEIARERIAERTRDDAPRSELTAALEVVRVMAELLRDDPTNARALGAAIVINVDRVLPRRRRPGGG